MENTKQKDKKISNEGILYGVDMPVFDPTPYIGDANVITDVERFEGQFGQYIRITGTTVETFKDGTEIKPSVIFSLVHDEETDAWGVGKGSKLDSFLEIMKVKTLPELIGKSAIIQTKKAKNSDKEFLTFRGA